MRPSGHIRKCMGRVAAGLPVETCLQELYVPGDEHGEGAARAAREAPFAPEEEAEFLNRVLMHLALGGPLNQYDDALDAYVGAAAAIYKALVRWAAPGLRSSWLLALLSLVLRACFSVSTGPRVRPGRATRRPGAAPPVQVVSHVYRVRDSLVRQRRSALFPDSPEVEQNFLYVTVTPATKALRVWYHAYLPSW